MLLALRDGTRALIRPITADDKPLIDNGLRRLSPATVYSPRRRPASASAASPR